MVFYPGSPKMMFSMKAENKMPMVAILLFAAVLTPISGLAAQLCRIGHGGLAPVGILTPYAALLFIGGALDLAPLWIAMLQFPIYAVALMISARRDSLGKVSLAILAAHCIAVVVVFARL
jgi:hypothetical protein